MTIHAYAAQEVRSPLAPFQYTAKPLSPTDIEVKISHCGVCHSDVHLIDNDWGFSKYPLVPGHEIIGNVSRLGADVKHLSLGQRVGIGWQRSSCGECRECLRGDENLCALQEATCVGHFGGFASNIVSDSRFAFPIPDALSSQNAAPLLCGGITVYAPLRHFGVLPNMRVGVIGIGGLGHLALQFARAFGCEVTAFSSSPNKEAEARQFGAHGFISSTNNDQMKAVINSLDLIVVTAFADLDWPSFVNLLRPNGNLCFVGIPAKPITIPVLSLLGGRKSISASPIGGRWMMTEMLEFAARHNIVAKTESLPGTQVNQALQKIRANQARYRMVLEF